MSKYKHSFHEQEQALSPPGPDSRLAHRDPITAMLQNTEFLSRLEQEVSRARLQRRPLGLVLFEISNMSRLDKDEAQTLLRTLASRLWDSAQTEDTLSRLDDSMLAFILPGSGPFHSLALAESVVNDVWTVCATLGQKNFPLRAAVASPYKADRADKTDKRDDSHASERELAEALLKNARRALKQASFAPDTPVRDRVRLYRRDEAPEERDTLVLANEKQFLFFGGI